jgi:hypothetical protein
MELDYRDLATDLYEETIHIVNEVAFEMLLDKGIVTVKIDDRACEIINKVIHHYFTLFKDKNYED